jgi:dihydroorotate dehydrogenase
VEHNLKEYRQGPVKEVKSNLEEHTAEESESAAFLAAAKKVATAVGQFIRPLLPKHSTPLSTGLLGVNLGKNKTSEDEIGDYRHGIQQLGPYSDYLVINVSSPNTPGLRDLQRPEALKELLAAAVEARDALPKPVPLLVKLAPDLTDDEMRDIATTVVDCGIDGLVVCNTTNTRPESVLSKESLEMGGLSGEPLKDRSTECIRILYKATDGNLPIIGVGGVGSGQDAYEKLRAGASLIQIYSMMVYEGPGVVTRIRHELAELMRQNGHRHLSDIVGLDHDDIYWRKREEQALKQQQSEKTIVVD